MESFVLKIRTADRTAVSVIAGPVENAYGPLVEAETMLDEEHIAIAVPSGVVADLLRRLETVGGYAR